MSGYQLSLTLAQSTRPQFPTPSKQSRSATVLGALRSLLREDLNFKGAKTNYASHNVHAFAAKFPPQLPGMFIEVLTSPKDVVLDPMAGSGTTLVEATLRGRYGIGCDLDPLAVKIAQMKTRSLSLRRVWETHKRIVQKAQNTRASAKSARKLLETTYSPEALEFFRYWFAPETIYELVGLTTAIRTLKDHALRNFFEVVFSSIIVTKSGGVSLARDLAHSRPHKVSDKSQKSAIDAFSEKVIKAMRALEEIESFLGAVRVMRSDSRKLPLADESVDLIITSPPYANAIDYVRAHKFSLIWLGYVPAILTSLRRDYIGAEVKADGPAPPSPTAREAIKAITAKDPQKGSVLAKYFLDMASAINEMYRVLKPGRACIIVVGSSTIRGIPVNTALALSELGTHFGFTLVGLKARAIDRDKRLMPISHKTKGRGIEARMHEEDVITLYKG